MTSKPLPFCATLLLILKKKEECIFEAIESHDHTNRLFDEINDLLLDIKQRLAACDILRVDDLALRNDLCAIRENRNFGYFNLLKLVNGTSENGDSNALRFRINLSSERWWKILSDEVLSQADPDFLISRRIQIGALLVGKTIPAEIQEHLLMIKECFAWGFDPAASIYCRTVLEEGFREALKPKPEFNTPQGKKTLEQYSLDWLLRHSKNNKYFYREVLERAYTIKENVNHIVHPTSARKPDMPMSSIGIIKNTFYVLEMLFR